MSDSSQAVKGRCQGGCFCGAVRFTFELPTLWCAHCHCSMCQRTHGAAFVTWVGVDQARCQLNESGALCWYASSSDGERGFCSTCGTTLFFRSKRWPGEIHIVRTNIDEAIDREPGAHAGWESHVAWVALNDDLPKRITKE